MGIFVFEQNLVLQELWKRSNSSHHNVTSASEVRSEVQKAMSAPAVPGETDLWKEWKKRRSLKTHCVWTLFKELELKLKLFHGPC